MPSIVRELLLLVVLLVGLAFVVYGLSLWLVPAAWIVAGLGLGGLGWLVLGGND
jgi:hypothetical protein